MTDPAARSDADRDPRRVSYYFDDGFYARAVAVSEEWRWMGAIPSDRLPDTADRAACERLLALECRLIDEDRLEEWLELFVPECLYWIPAEPVGRDPRRTVTLEIHDRRRLEDRVARLRTGFAYSQIPPSRTRHLLTNIEMWTAGADEIRARANFLIHAFRLEHHKTHAGWMGYALKRTGADWKIEIKQINLIDADYGQENITFTL